MSAWKEALDSYYEISDELASLQEQRGDLRSVAISAWRDGWVNAGGEGVTIRREQAKLASAATDMQIEKLTGEIEAAQTRLRYLDQYLTFLQNQAREQETP